MNEQSSNKLSTETEEETHCPVCGETVNPLDNYFRAYGFCSIPCGAELYGVSPYSYS